MLVEKADAYVQENEAAIRKFTSPAAQGAVDLPEFQKTINNYKASVEQREQMIEQGWSTNRQPAVEHGSVSRAPERRFGQTMRPRLEHANTRAEEAHSESLFG